jgi:energy-coupling factor transporter ATP-binding protein EcfA2
MQDESNISYIARTNGRHPHKTFGIHQRDRLFHMYTIGKTGAGKSTLLESLALQDIREGRGLAVIDPHGDLAERLSKKIPESRQDDLIYLDAADPSQPYGYNPLRRIQREKIPLAASGLMEAFKKLFGEAAWGPRMEHVFRCALYALLEYGEATLPDILRLPTDSAFRAEVLKHVRNRPIQEFWKEEFPKYSYIYQREAIAPIQNKVGAFLADPRLYRMLTAPPVDLHIRTVMDERKILIVNLSKGRLGEDSANLLGALLLSTISLAAFSRADIPESQRQPFFLYIDEFQSFTTRAVVNMVSELRKYRIGLILAHQHLHQLEPDVRHAVLANVGTLIAFRLGPEDAPIIARELAPTFDAEDLLNLPRHDIALKLMIDGAPCRPFSATTMRIFEGP